MTSSTSAVPRPAVALPRADEVLAEEAVGQWRLVWDRFRRHRLGLVGLVIITVIVGACFLGPWLAPYPYDQQDTALIMVFDGPSPQHWLGADELGRDVLSRLLYAGRISLSVALVATTLSIVVGLVLGAVAGYFGGLLEQLLMRFTDMMLSLPALPLLLIFSKVFQEFGGFKRAFGENVSVVVIIGVLTLFGWMSVARLVHSSILSLKAQEFTEAAQALGASSARIIWFHLIPNSLAPIIVVATLGIGGKIIAEASLSFLGLGIVPPTPSWGNMLNDVQAYMWRNPWLAFYPGSVILVVVLAFNFMGDALRDALDPRLKH